jgi:Spy/CpxP family protein refolding chaperone
MFSDAAKTTNFWWFRIRRTQGLNIKKYLLPVAASLLVATTGIALAQQPGNPAQAQLQAQQQMEKELGITAEQKKKLTTISNKYRPKLEALNKKYDPQFKALQKKMQQLQQKAMTEARPTLTAQQKEMDSVLTPAQKAKIKQMQAGQRQ